MRYFITQEIYVKYLKKHDVSDSAAGFEKIQHVDNTVTADYKHTICCIYQNGIHVS